MLLLGSYRLHIIHVLLSMENDTKHFDAMYTFLGFKFNPTENVTKCNKRNTEIM